MENGIVPRWILKSLGILLIIFLALLIINELKTIYGSHQTMNISAQGKVMSVPDLAIVKIGVVTEGTDAQDVKNKNNQKMNQLIDFIKNQDVSKDSIQTSDFYTTPKYSYVNGQSNIVGYQANQIITIKFFDIDKSRKQIEKVLDGAINNGANQIQGINFGFSDPEKLRKLARKQAIDNAKQRAKELTSAANLHLGNIINIIESNDTSVPAPFMSAMNYAREKSIAPDIQLGSQDIIENITLVFEVD